LALISKMRKGKGKGFPKKGGSDGEGHEHGKKKDMNKIKCFIFHKHDYYAFQCPEKKKSKGKTQWVATTTDTQLSEFATKLENEFSPVSCLSTNTIHRND
jgi:hypothetical protein